MTKPAKPIVDPAAAVAALAASAWTARAFRDPRDVQVMSAPVTTGSIVRAIVATGTLEPVATVQVGAQISGTIAALYADYNSIVHKGDVLATLDTAQLDAELRGAEAALDVAQAALDRAVAARAGFSTAVVDAETKLSREESLAARELVPGADLDAARNAASQARADLAAGESQIAVAAAGVEQARAQLAQARVNLDHAVITLPIDGIVVVAQRSTSARRLPPRLQAPVLFLYWRRTSRTCRWKSTSTRPTSPALRPARRSPSTWSRIPTRSGARLRRCGCSRSPRTMTATPAGGPSQTTSVVASVVGYAAIVDVPNPDGLRPGMTATATLRGARVDRALRIPNAALTFRPPDDVLAALRQTIAPVATGAAPDPAVRRVWRYDGAQFMPVEVRTGITDGEGMQALGGALREGELLVTSASIGRGERIRD